MSVRKSFLMFISLWLVCGASADPARAESLDSFEKEVIDLLQGDNLNSPGGFTVKIKNLNQDSTSAMVALLNRKINKGKKLPKGEQDELVVALRPARR